MGWVRTYICRGQSSIWGSHRCSEPSYIFLVKIAGLTFCPIKTKLQGVFFLLPIFTLFPFPFRFHYRSQNTKMEEHNQLMFPGPRLPEWGGSRESVRLSCHGRQSSGSSTTGPFKVPHNANNPILLLLFPGLLVLLLTFLTTSPNVSFLSVSQVSNEASLTSCHSSKYNLHLRFCFMREVCAYLNNLKTCCTPRGPWVSILWRPLV